MPNDTFQKIINGIDLKKTYMLAFIPLANLVSLALVIMRFKNAQGWEQSHYTWLLRTFIIGCLVSVVGGFVVRVIFGLIGLGILAFLVNLAVVVWYYYRVYQGFALACQHQPVPNPDEFLFQKNA